MVRFSQILPFSPKDLRDEKAPFPINLPEPWCDLRFDPHTIKRPTACRSRRRAVMTIPLPDSPRKSSLLARGHEKTVFASLQVDELECLNLSAEAPLSANFR